MDALIEALTRHHDFSMTAIWRPVQSLGSWIWYVGVQWPDAVGTPNRHGWAWRIGDRIVSELKFIAWPEYHRAWIAEPERSEP